MNPERAKILCVTEDDHGDFVADDGMAHYPMFEDSDGLTDVSLEFLERKGVA